uniref:Uncharacterized protein n=1 Tax=Anopheles culicifacies TaxID=139723 RepID=A0A182M104_9DIPT
MKEVSANGHLHLSNGSNGTVADTEPHTNGSTNGYAGHNGTSNGTSTSNGCSSKKQSVKCTCNKSGLDTNGSDTNNNQAGIEMAIDTAIRHANVACRMFQLPFSSAVLLL